MSRATVRRIHLAASLSAFAIVAAFLAATVSAEIAGGDAPAHVKDWVARALVVLIPVMAAAGLSGRRLAGSSRAPVVLRKLRSTQVVAAVGILVLVPCALALVRLDGPAFSIVHVVELLAGAVNITLLALNMRDGMAMRAGRSRRKARPVAHPVA